MKEESKRMEKLKELGLITNIQETEKKIPWKKHSEHPCPLDKPIIIKTLHTKTHQYCITELNEYEAIFADFEWCELE